MIFNLELSIMFFASIAGLVLLLFAVDWFYFRDWVVVFLFKNLLDNIFGIVVVNLNLLEYPVRFLPHLFEGSLLFEFWIFPILCILYNQVTRVSGLGAILYYAFIYSALITGAEYILEVYTDLIHYINWHWYTTLVTIFATFLISRAFIAFFRWGCHYFPSKYRY